MRENGGGPGAGVAFQTKEKDTKKKTHPQNDKNKPAGGSNALPPDANGLL